jgi:hypothetical protein
MPKSREVAKNFQKLHRIATNTRWGRFFKSQRQLPQAKPKSCEAREDFHRNLLPCTTAIHPPGESVQVLAFAIDWQDESATLF